MAGVCRVGEVNPGPGGAFVSFVTATLRPAVAGIALLASGRWALAAEVSRLAVGEIVVTSRAVEPFDQPQVRLEAVIDAAPHRVWSIVTDCANFKTTMPTILASEEVSHEGNVVVCRSTLDLVWPLPNLDATTRVVHTVGDGLWRAEWTLVSGARRAGAVREDPRAPRDDPRAAGAAGGPGRGLTSLSIGSSRGERLVYPRSTFTRTRFPSKTAAQSHTGSAPASRSALA